MALRLFLDLASRLTDYRNVTEIMDPSETVAWIINYQDPAKFHVGMLTISLLVGLAYAGYVGYSHWMEKDILVGYVRNLAIALCCRTFFSILFDGVILLGSSADVGGGNTLSAFEQISAALVLAFWLTLTIYLHARVQRDFNSEPTLKVYQYGVPGVALFFAFVWIFTMQDQHPNLLWWIVQRVQVHSKWIINGIYLLFLLIQLGLMADIVRMMMTKKSSLDNDSITLFMRVGIIMGVLVLIFWLQFGFYLGQMFWNSTSYVYFDYLIDGLEGTLISICLFFFLKWVPTFTKSNLRTLSSTETTTVTDTTTEERVPGARGITTVDSIFTTRESGRLSISQDDGRNDVVYSNVIEPERLKKTLELYNRFDIIPKKTVTVIDGDEFYDCRIPISEPRKLSKKKKFRNDKNKKLKRTQKRNAFYSSKYLILDQKDVEIPKYLETRPSISSTSDTPKEERTSVFSDIPVYEMYEMVDKWLTGNAEDMRGPVKAQPERQSFVEENKSKDPHSSDNDSRNEKIEKKPDIVIDLDPQPPKTKTAEEVNNKNEKIFISTIASKLAEKIGLSTPSPTSEGPASPQPQQNQTDSTKLPQTNEEQQQHPTTGSSIKTSPQVIEKKNTATNKREDNFESNSSSSSMELTKDDIKPLHDHLKNVEPDNDIKNLIPRQIVIEMKKETSESSDSEFSIEGRKSSKEIFSLENYYSGVIAAKSKITTRQNFPRFNNPLRISAA